MTQDRHGITIVIPLYNKEDFILEAIDSVLNQTFPCLELLVVDDGSTDRSAVVAAERIRTDERARMISIANSGVSVARNTGIVAASYSWVALLDGDDWWAPTFLEELTSSMSVYPNEVMFASGRCRIGPLTCLRYENASLPPDGETGTVNYFEVLPKDVPVINSSNVLIRRSHFLEAGLFRPGQSQHEDHDLWMRLAVQNKVVVVNKCLSFYRISDTTSSASQGFYSAPDFRLFMTTILETVNRLDGSELCCMRAYASRFCLLTYAKNCSKYSVHERENLGAQIEELLSPLHRIAFWFVSNAPFDVYRVIRPFWGCLSIARIRVRGFRVSSGVAGLASSPIRREGT